MTYNVFGGTLNLAQSNPEVIASTSPAFVSPHFKHCVGAKECTSV